MKKRLYSMMLLLTLMLFAQSAQAQFSASISEELKDDYATTNIPFSLAEVATTLNTTADVLIEELDKWKSSGYPMTDIFTLDGQTNLSHSADDGGFYMDKSGQMSWWSSEGYWYCQLYWDAEADDFKRGSGTFESFCFFHISVQQGKSNVFDNWEIFDEVEILEDKTDFFGTEFGLATSGNIRNILAV